ncbi:MAG TPA: TGS domain-containing protein [Patescibacteria group bacterium]|jgi:(p)ppGpp synthase/HD superfamily hydrolase
MPKPHQKIPGLPADRFESAEHPWGEDELRPDALAQLRAIGPERWADIAGALESDRPAYEVDWQELPPTDELAARLEVMGYVKALLPPDNIENQKENHNVTLENYLKLLFEAAGHQDNLRTFLEFARGRIEESGEQGKVLAEQAFLLWAPAAEIMGWHGLKERLEKTAFKTLMPGEVSRIRETYVEMFGGEDEEAREKALATATERYDRLIGNEIKEKIPDLEGRVGVNARRKSYYSVWRKCRQRGRTDYELPDFFGARVVIDIDSEQGEEGAIAKCYEVVSVLNEKFDPDYDRYKDYIQLPKANGYQSIHLTLYGPDGVPMEVQIRTSKMHERASGDPDVSHLAYEAASKLTPGKFRGKGVGQTRMYRWRTRAAMRLREDPNVELASLRPPELLVFSPDGNVHHVPEGATVLDVSFAADSDRALRTKRVWINGKPARFDDPVQTGDVVDAECAPKKYGSDGTWTESWLQSVKTPRARKRLRRAELDRQAEKYRSRAWQLLKERFPDLEFPDPKDPMSFLSAKGQEVVMRKYSVKNGDMLLRRIGSGRARPDSLEYWIRRRLAELKDD